MKLSPEELIEDSNRLTAGLHRIYVFSVIIALILLGLIYYVFHITNQMNKTHAPMQDAAMELELEITKAHLWFEEIMGGDRHEDLKTVWSHLRQADWYARVMLEGGENEHNVFIALENEQMKKSVQRVRKKLEEFRTIIKQRVASKEPSLSGSDVDQLFDGVYNDLLDESDKLEENIKVILKEEFNHLQLAQKALLAGCVLVFVILGLIYMRFNRQQLSVVQILTDSKDKLEKEMEERKKAEEEIQLQNEEMQKRLLEIAELRDLDEERLADLNLANEQLRIAIDETDANNHDKSEFFAGMTHEMRTPANAIIDLTYITLDTHLDDEQRGKINTIKESAYSNIVPDIIGDKGRLWQIMIHLVGNAIKFTGDGKIDIGVERVFFGAGNNSNKTISEPEHVLLRFSVCDTGVGIPEEKLVGIFEHFNSEGNPAIKEFGETRLGLHISNKLVHMMGGEIWVESNEGEGSSFYFTVMFDMASGSEKPEPSPDAVIDETGSSASTGVEYTNPGELPTT
jgi:signal transduction histidine kinase